MDTFLSFVSLYFKKCPLFGIFCTFLREHIHIPNCFFLYTELFFFYTELGFLLCRTGFSFIPNLVFFYTELGFLLYRIGVFFYTKLFLYSMPTFFYIPCQLFFYIPCRLIIYRLFKYYIQTFYIYLCVSTMFQSISSYFDWCYFISTYSLYDTVSHYYRLFHIRDLS